MGNVCKGVDRLATICPVNRERMNEDMPFVIVAPTYDEHNWIIAFETLQKFISNVIKNEYADKSRIYLCGSSMGGYTCWNLLIAKPDIFAAAAECILMPIVLKYPLLQHRVNLTQLFFRRKALL